MNSKDRIVDIEHALECNDQSERKIEELEEELDYCNCDLTKTNTFTIETWLLQDKKYRHACLVTSITKELYIDGIKQDNIHGDITLVSEGIYVDGIKWTIPE